MWVCLTAKEGHKSAFWTLILHDAEIYIPSDARTGRGFRRVHIIAKNHYYEIRHVCLSVCPSVRPCVRPSAWNISTPT
jgi:hypothetical protein